MLDDSGTVLCRADATLARPWMTDPPRTRVTTLLLEARAAGEDATSRLAELLYPELRRLAGALMRRERPDHTLQPTALVGEAFLRLVDQDQVTWQDRAHFLGVAARVMRQVLVDHARKRRTDKRGGGTPRVTFDDALGHGAGDEGSVLDLHRALEKLAEFDPRGARVAELRLFGGLTVVETAEVTGVSERTARNDWAVARLWLARELGLGARPPGT
jgi:RNA polymerase sigma factor (TIGR02999 family)